MGRREACVALVTPPHPRAHLFSFAQYTVAMLPLTYFAPVCVFAAGAIRRGGKARQFAAYALLCVLPSPPALMALRASWLGIDATEVALITAASCEQFGAESCAQAMVLTKLFPIQLLAGYAFLRNVVSRE